jgi:hypothetical protein
VSFEIQAVRPAVTEVSPASKRARDSFALQPIEPERDDFVEPLLPLVPECESHVWWWCGPRGDRRDGDYLRRSYVVG